MIEIVLSAVAYTILILLLVYFVYRNVVLRRNLHNEITSRLQASIDKNIIMAEYKSTLQIIENMKLEKSDDFIKFLSDSRDWAFTYIEDAQEKMSEFDKQIQEIVEWNRTYGSVIGDIPHTSKIEEINLAYDKIRSLLPENKTPNN